jgi:hypothetical protein
MDISSGREKEVVSEEAVRCKPNNGQRTDQQKRPPDGSLLEFQNPMKKGKLLFIPPYY